MWKYVFILLLPIVSFAQEPAHTVFGSNELEDVVIYSMIQDERANIWLSTSNGLFKYDGYDFKEIYDESIPNKSYFGLVQDNNNRVYCYNTSGQILKVDKDTLTVQYTLPDSLYGNFYYINFDNLNNLIVSGKNFYKISEGSIKTILNQDSFHEFPMVKKEDGSLEFYSSLDNDLYLFRDNKITRQHVTLDFGKYGFYYPILSKRKEYIGVGRSSDIYQRNGKTFKKIEIGINKPTGCWTFVDHDEDIWVLSNQKGVYLHSTNKNLSRFNHKVLFPSYTFSCQLEDRDGNIWLGTFGKGVVQISDKENQIINNSSLPNNDELKCIAKNNEGDILAGSLSGNLYEFANDGIDIVDSFPGRMDRLEYDKFINRFYFKNISYNYSKKDFGLTPYGSVRKITHSADSISVLTTYSGVFIKDRTFNQRHREALDEFEYPSGDFGYAIKVNRTNCAAYDSKAKTIWIGGSGKLKFITKDGENEFKINDESIVALDLLWVDKDLYVTTLKLGVLVIRDKKLFKHINVEDGLISSTIGKINRQGGKLYFAAREGLQEMNLNDFTFRNFKNSNGKRLKVQDFEITGNTAFILHSRGIQTININSQAQKVSAPILDFTSILVDKQEKMYDSDISIDYTKNNILFKFAAKTYNSREQLKYKYQIIGLNDTWEEIPYDENFIRLVGLEHGDYTLCLYAIDSQGQLSNVLYYSFSINQPIWRAWWFYVLISGVAIGFVILFYRRRMKIQKKKSDQQNELNASKLTAIQSQMNPHFIFNSLNSIQDLVMQGDTENSYTFITKFANLVRKTLNYSDKDFIEFDQEVQLLELYLSLERLRFSNNFDYEIETNNVTDILIPPMLIQPFIENALVHGLLHKDGEKDIYINFELGEHLICTITDNGVGRARAKEIKERQQSKHESFAVQAIKKRLAILEGKFDSSIGFEYIDLMEDGKAVGTTVVIKIPAKRLF